MIWVETVHPFASLHAESYMWNFSSPAGCSLQSDCLLTSWDNGTIATSKTMSLSIITNSTRLIGKEVEDVYF
jgi:hypothetical protein